MPGVKVRMKTESSVHQAVRAVWKRREPVLWAAIFALVVTVQWPALKGWYYRATGAAAPASGIAWRTDVGGALAEARSAHKRVLVDFSASWCPPCIAMKHEVWPDPEVTRAIAAGYVPVMVDADHDDGLSARYQVDGIPAVLILGADGRILKRNDGFLPKAGMLRFLAEAARRPNPAD